MRPIVFSLKTSEPNVFFGYPEVADINIGIAPTGTGKSTATIRLMTEMLDRGYVKKVIFALPMKALVAQFVRELEQKIQQMGKQYTVLRDDSDARLTRQFPASWNDYDFIVATYERVASVLNTAPPSFFYKYRPAVVIDEFHYITTRTTAVNDIAEIVLEHMVEYGRSLRLFMLSATFPDADRFSQWFSEFGRPVVVVKGEGRKIQHEVYFLKAEGPNIGARTQAVLDWVEKLGLFGTGTIFIYVPARWMAYFVRGEILKRWPNASVAIHHGGMLAEEREKVEDCILGKISELDGNKCPPDFAVATDTLSVGTNFPFVAGAILSIYRSEHYMVDAVTVAQTIGRVGRPGLVQASSLPVALVYADQHELSVYKQALAGDFRVESVSIDYDGIALRLIYLNKPVDLYADYSPVTAVVDDFREALKSKVGEITGMGLCRDSPLTRALARSYPDSDLIRGYVSVANSACSLSLLSKKRNPADVLSAVALMYGFTLNVNYYIVGTQSSGYKNLFDVMKNEVARTRMVVPASVLDGTLGAGALKLVRWFGFMELDPTNYPGVLLVSTACRKRCYVFDKSITPCKCAGSPMKLVYIDNSELIEPLTAYSDSEVLRDTLKLASRFLSPVLFLRELDPEHRELAKLISAHFNILATDRVAREVSACVSWIIRNRWKMVLKHGGSRAIWTLYKFCKKVRDGDVSLSLGSLPSVSEAILERVTTCI